MDNLRLRSSSHHSLASSVAISGEIRARVGFVSPQESGSFRTVCRVYFLPTVVVCNSSALRASAIAVVDRPERQSSLVRALSRLKSFNVRISQRIGSPRDDSRRRPAIGSSHRRFPTRPGFRQRLDQSTAGQPACGRTRTMAIRSRGGGWLLPPPQDNPILVLGRGTRCARRTDLPRWGVSLIGFARSAGLHRGAQSKR